jgi:hypothetical protein
MDNKFYVSLEAARLLKEKGYDEDVELFYNTLGKLEEVNCMFCCDVAANTHLAKYDYLSAPTKAEAIDWLESKGVMISPHPVTILREDGTTKIHWSCYIVQKDGTWYTTNDLPTRLEAEDAAIIKALELL